MSIEGHVKIPARIYDEFTKALCDAEPRIGGLPLSSLAVVPFGVTSAESLKGISLDESLIAVAVERKPTE